MTAWADATDPVLAFRAALPAWARAELEMTPAAVADVHLAVAAGWDAVMLAHHVEYRTTGLVNAGERMRWRLRRAAHPDETDGDDAA